MPEFRTVLTAACIAAGLVLAAAPAAAQQMFRWVDKDGKVRYTDTPPPAFVKDVEKRPLEPGPAGTPQGSYALQQAAKKFPVVLYTADQCGAPCTDAMALLEKRGIPFRQVVVGTEETRAALTKVAGAVEVPTLTVGREVQRGYEASLYHGLLDTAGYPKAPVPGTRQAAPPPAPEPKQPAVAQAKPPETPPSQGRYAPQAAPDSPPADPGKGRYLPQ